MIHLAMWSHQYNFCFLALRSNFSSLSLPFMNNCRSVILLFRHINQISLKNYKHLQSNSYLYPLQILLCLLAVAVKSVSSQFLKYIMCFMHSQMSSLRCLFESPCLLSLLSPLYFQDKFLIRKKKNYIWQDKLKKLEFRSLNWLQWGSAEAQNQVIPTASHPPASLFTWLLPNGNNPKLVQKDGAPFSTINHLHVCVHICIIHRQDINSRIYIKIIYRYCIPKIWVLKIPNFVCLLIFYLMK